MSFKEDDLIVNRYKVLEKLGDGCYAKVYLVMDQAEKKDAQTPSVYAIKCIHKKHLRSNPELGQNLYREVKIHQQLNHKNIVRFYNEFDDNSHIFFLLEVISPGELHDLIHQSDEGPRNEIGGFTENRARWYMNQIISALVYLKEKGIIHRDLKPENILVNHDDIIKIADFGWATTKTSNSSVGTTSYNSPEMIKYYDYNYKTDIWSIGVILFEMIFCKLPFKGKNDRLTEKLITNGHFSFPKEPDVSEELMMFIKYILCYNCDKRPDYDQLKSHKWMNMDNIVNHALASTSSNSDDDSRHRNNGSHRNDDNNSSDRDEPLNYNKIPLLPTSTFNQYKRYN